MNAVAVDSIDLQIIELLRGDPRMTNKEIADKADISELAVANRIRALVGGNVVRVAAQRDIVSLGHDLLAMLNIHVQGRTARAVSEEVALIDEVSSVALMLGTPQVSALIHARDREHLHALISGPIASIEGIVKLEADVMLDVLKFRSDLAKLLP